MTDGKMFESDVRNLLSLQGWNISNERLLGHKRVDAYAEKYDAFGRTQRVAVECKDLQKVLTQDDVSFIYHNYHPLIESNYIDFVVIVTKRGVAPSAEAYISGNRALRHVSYQVLSNTIIDFRAYVEGLRHEFVTSTVAKHYVAQSFAEGKSTLEEHLLDWVNSPDSQPIAIMAGYGLGKTTLVKRLAHVLAEISSRDPSARIPVVLPLASIASEQTLEGLLGRQFTSVSVCPNYNFPLFMALNAAGKFVIFLDGLDEMKKTISWDALLYNMEQLHALIGGQTKILLLGRPSTFLTDEEHNEALHGVRRRMGQNRQIPGWPDYQELHLNPFSRRQVATFIDKYLIAFKPRDGQDERRLYRIRSHLDDINGRHGKRLVDLASRPVQLTMLMELLPDYDGKLDQLTVSVLYAEFIDLLLRREIAKPARRSFALTERKRFASRLAYWMWQDNQRSSIVVGAMPDDLFSDLKGVELQDKTPDDIKRDLLSGGFLDRRPPSQFYFPHRSLQEYLVAEELAFFAQSGDSKICECGYLTPEIVSFFIEIVGKRGIASLRQQWDEKVELSDELRQLINAGCAYYNMKLLRATPKEDRRAGTSRGVSTTERDALLRRLAITGLVKGTIEQQVKKKKKGKPNKNMRSPHQRVRLFNQYKLSTLWHPRRVAKRRPRRPGLTGNALV